MRINEIRIQNFKGFKDLTETFDPNFTVFVGENGSGKTSMLEAVGVSLYSWHLSMGNHVVADLSGVRIGSRVIGSTIEFSEEIPMVLEVSATDSGKTLKWSFFDDRKQSLSAESYNNQLYKHLAELRARRESGEYLFDIWPLLAFYSAERGRGEVQKLNWNAIFGENPKRTDAYKEWKSDTSLVTQFTAWLGREEAIAFQENRETSAARTVKKGRFAI
jgi:predicted ATP-binding protein involved in virulence